MKLSKVEKKLLRWWQNSTEFSPPVLRGISISGDPGIRGIQKLDIDFNYPLTVICGKNGSGKSTILALAALGFHSPEGHVSINASLKRNSKADFNYYTFKDFFFKGPGDPDVTGVKITWKYRSADNIGNELKIKKHSTKWMHYERRPIRPVHYIGAFRSLPAIEQRELRSRFGGTPKDRTSSPLNEAFCRRLSEIMGRSYDEADVMSSARYSVRRCKYGTTYSSFNMGSGEDIIITLMYILQECPNGSLIAIEEIELGIHPEALIRLAHHIQEIILEKKLQVIVSTHSNYFIDNVPQEARILIQRSGRNTHSVISRPTTRFAMGVMSGEANPELHVYCEDEFAELLIKQAILGDLLKRTHIVQVGPDSQLATQAAFHLRANFGQHLLLVWDGDVTQNKAKKWLETEHLDGNRDRVNWIIFPGSEPPEKWVLMELDNSEGHELLGKELGCEDHAAAELIEEVRALSDHHEVRHHLARKMNISPEEALTILAKSVSRLSDDPLRSVREAVDAVLNGQHVQPEEAVQETGEGPSSSALHDVTS